MFKGLLDHPMHDLLEPWFRRLAHDNWSEYIDFEVTGELLAMFNNDEFVKIKNWWLYQLPLKTKKGINEH